MSLHLSRFPLTAKLMLGVCVLLVFSVQPICAQAICETCNSTYQSPAAVPDGPYIGMTGQNISFNDAGSWSGEGLDYGLLLGLWRWNELGSGAQPNSPVQC